MGKDGKRQAAASSKAADMLATGFNGFQQGFQTMSVAGDEYACLDPALRLVLKKISKRDSVTKQKAIDELNSLLTGNKDFIQQIIPSWESLFNKLALDVDRKVREATLNCHSRIVQSSSKQIAPILKKIIGTWIICRFDQSKEIINLATSSFEKCFPQKQAQVLVFCQDELIGFFRNNLLEQSPETMSDPRFSSKEEISDKYDRVISGCLDGLSFVLGT
jgi:hypothetical protein